MFERFTENARRTLFFARYETSELGGSPIEVEHLLLGLLRTDRGPLPRMFALANLSYRDARAKIAARAGARERIAQHVEIPFSGEAKRALDYAVEEANRADHEHVGTADLLAGILREDGSFAAGMLNDHGISLNTAREQLSKPDTIAGSEPEPKPKPKPERDAGEPAPAIVLRREAFDPIVAVEHVRMLAEQLANPEFAVERRITIDAIHQRLDLIKQQLARSDGEP